MRLRAMIDATRRARRWAASTFLRPASVTLVTRPAAVIRAAELDRTG